MNAPEQLTSLINLLADLAKHLRRWRLLAASTASGFSFLALMLVFQLTVSFFPVREAIAVNLFIVVIALWLILTGFYIVRVRRSQPDLSALANRLESRNPELYDHLNCAVDIGLKNKDDLSPIEQLVIKKADASLDTINVYQSAGYERDQKQAMVAALLICLLMLGSVGQWPASKNLFYALKDRLTGENTGLSVEPGSAEFPEHSDITIRADIHRGLKQANIEYQIGDSLNQASMYQADGGNNRADFTFFDTTEPINYRVNTPDFSSQWYHLSIYSLPKIGAISWQVLPPPYTQLPQTRFTDVKHIKAPEGSNILIQVAADNELSVKMVTPFESIPLVYKDKLYQHHYQVQWLQQASHVSADAADDLTVYFFAENKDRRSVQTEPNIVDIVPDKKPVLEIVNPGADVSLKSDETVTLELYLADDYGLSKASLNVAVKGDRKTIPLNLASNKKDQRQKLPLVMTDLNAKPGDLVSYYLTATDNRQPQPQISRSEIFFIEMGSKKDEIKKLTRDRETKNSGSDKKELPIREFIVKTKKIIRQSFATVDSLVDKSGAGERAQTIRDIAQDTLTLKQSMNKVYVQSKTSFKMVENIDTGKLILEAVHALESAIIELNRQAIQASIENTSITLQRLVRFDSLMKRLSASQGGAKGSIGNPSESGNSSNQISEQSNHEKQLKKMNAIKEALQKTRTMIEAQQNLNIRISNAERLPSQTIVALAGSQQELEQQTAELSRSLYDATGRLKVVSILNQARMEMQSSQEFLSKKQAALASPEGIRAMESLQMAAVNLKRELYSLANKTLGSAKDRGEKLTQQQKSTIEHTQQRYDAEELEKEQESLNSTINQYSTELQQTSRLLRNLNETTSQSLNALNSSERRSQRQSHQNRAMNALLYELFDQAEKEQQQIVRSLQHLTNGIEDIQQSLAGERGNLLTGAVQSIDEVLKGINQMSAKKLQAFAKQLAGRLEDSKIAESDYRLAEAVELLKDLGQRQDVEYLKQDMEWALQKTKPVLHTQLWQKAIHQITQQSQEKGQLPGQYRRAVEDYFRRLAEESRKK